MTANNIRDFGRFSFVGHRVLGLKERIRKMGVERVDYYSEEEYQQALQEERQFYNSQPQEPDVVPCFKCGCQMYEESPSPEGNVCENCKKADSSAEQGGQT